MKLWPFPRSPGLWCCSSPPRPSVAGLQTSAWGGFVLCPLCQTLFKGGLGKRTGSATLPLPTGWTEKGVLIKVHSP